MYSFIMTDTKQSLTILFPPWDGIGHVNACIGVAQALQHRGHRIVFALNEQWRGKLSAYGFEEELISDPERDPNDDPTKHHTEFALKMGVLMAMPPRDKLKIMSRGFQAIIDKAKSTDPIMKEIVARIRPDIIVIDTLIMMPSLINCGIPWVLLSSSNPLFILNDKRLPPRGFGLSVKSNKNEWLEMNKLRKAMLGNTFKNYNNWLVESGVNRLPDDGIRCISPYLNLYGYPEEIDYTDIIEKIPDNFYRMDYFIRSEKNSVFEVPDKLRNMSGKLIYLSLGSMGSGNIDLMKRLVAILAKSRHRIIVSKGQFHDQYELADNMWGDRTVPQTKVLPLVDLVITHGGNNTLTESLYFGKPMIVMPLMGDQYDNAQRLQDTGYGVRLDGFKCSDNELLEAIDHLLDNKELAIKLEKMCARMQSSDCLNKAAQLVEALANI